MPNPKKLRVDSVKINLGTSKAGTSKAGTVSTGVIGSGRIWRPRILRSEHPVTLAASTNLLPDFQLGGFGVPDALGSLCKRGPASDSAEMRLRTPGNLMAQSSKAV